MKAIAILVSIMCCLGVAHTATPKMWIKDAGNRVPLRIDTIEADITITGNVAETVLLLRFRNETPRLQEGEFVMPLPAGSTVSQYALEVNGALRAGVAVEKKQARHAYETIKNRKIDPGLVEREANNTYRTKVYPIPAKGTKLIRIGYIERIPVKDGKLLYTLPTDYPGEINQFKCRIHHGAHLHQKLTINGNGLDFKQTSKTRFEASVENKKLNGDITIVLPRTAQPQLSIEKDANVSYFHLDYTLANNVIGKPRTGTDHIHIIWDASGSCRHRDISKDLNLLGFYFKHLKNTRVTLQLLRNELHNAGEFSVKNGDWKKLRKTLEATFYDGSSAYHLIESAQIKAGLTLLFTDGIDSERIRISPNQPTIILHQSQGNHLQRATYQGCGYAVNLNHTKPESALSMLTHTPFRVLKIQTGSLSAVIPTNYLKQGQQSITGKCSGTINKPIKITYINGNGETIHQSVSSHVRNSTSSSLVKRIWAQQELLSLEYNSSKPSTIIKHCRHYGLVSDFTSLIVLERFRDYVEFNIPPPEPDLHRKWKIAISKQSHSQRIQKLTQHAWNDKVHWHQRSFSWLPHGLLAKYRQTNIWLNAVDSVFDRQNLDTKTLGVIEAWKKKTATFVREQDGIKNDNSLKLWLSQHDLLVKEWNNFQQLESKVPTGKKMTLSIRGLVNNPLTYHAHPPVTLKQSIGLAGGFHSSGSPQAVSLYRNAQALTYNVASKHYKDIPLQPGDMIVVSPEPYGVEAPLGGDDPFGETDSSPVNPANLPAVSNNTPQVSHNSGSDDPFGGGDDGSFDGMNFRLPTVDSNQPQILAKRSIEKPQVIPPQQWKQFEASLGSQEKALMGYQKLIGNAEHHTTQYVQAARMLVKHKHRQLAIQALSNIPENQFMSPTSQRAYLYWLGEFKIWSEALSTLNAVHYPKDGQRRLDYARFRYRGQVNDQGQEASKHYDVLASPYRSRAHPGHTLLALTARNNLGKVARKNTYQFHADIRCVIYSSNPEAGLDIQVNEPMDHLTRARQISQQGGRIFRSPGITEYMIKKAIPGTYSIEYTCDQPTTLQLVVYQNYGKPSQSSRWFTLTANPNRHFSTIHTIKQKFPK